jgi:hypothetical protein
MNARPASGRIIRLFPEAAPPLSIYLIGDHTITALTSFLLAGENQAVLQFQTDHFTGFFRTSRSRPHRLD